MKDKLKPRGYWSRMSDEDILRYISDNHKGKNINELQKSKDRQAYDVVRKRGLIGCIIEQGILTRGKLPNGYWDEKSDAEVIQDIKDKHTGKTLIQFAKSEDKTLYQVARKRKLIESLVREGILIRERRKNGTFNGLNDVQLTDFIIENYRGQTINQFRRRKHKRAYTVALERGLIEGLVEQGVLVRKIIKGNYYQNMNDEELIKYFLDNYKGQTISDLQRGKNKNSTAYSVARKRGLINQLVENGILIRKKRHGYWTKMSDEKLIEYVKKNHHGDTVTRFIESDRGVSREVYKRKLIPLLLEQGILIRVYGNNKNPIKILEYLLDVENNSGGAK